MPTRRRRQQGLERVLGTPALFATAYGNVGSSIYYALGVTAAFALGLTPIVFVIAGLIFAATSATYAEGTVRYPEAGGSSSFARHAFNELASFGAAWAQMLVYVATVAISAFFVPHYLSVFWEPLRENPWDIVVGAIVVVLLVGINIVGVKEATSLNVLLAVVDFATQALLVGIGFFLVFDVDTLTSNVELGVAPTWDQFFIAIPIAMLAYTGVETVSNLAEEVRDPPRNVPNAYKLIALAVFAIYFTLPAIALSALPVFEQDGEFVTKLGLGPEEGGFTNDPVLGVVQNLGLSQGMLLDGLEIYVGVLAATILFIATNAGVIGASRITYAMSGYRQLPLGFRRLHPRFKTPWIALVVFAGVIPILTILPGQTDFLGTMYSFGATLSFTVAHASIVALRYRRRDEELVYRARPNWRVRGVDWPLFAIVGGIGTLLAWVVIVVQDADDALGRDGLDRTRLRRVCDLSPAVAEGAADGDRAGAGDRARPVPDGRVPDDRRPGRAHGRVGGSARRGRAPRGRARLPRRRRPRDRGASGPAARRGASGRGSGGGRDPRPVDGDRRELRDQRRRPFAQGSGRRAGDRGRGGAAERGARHPRRAAPEGRARADLRPHRRLRPQAQPLARSDRGGTPGRMTVALAWVMIALGVAVVVRTLAAGVGGGLGLVLGVLLVLAGGLRLYLHRARGL